ncbi:unnamed protein product [Gordionus sp. m RMFG-2023]
MLKEEEKVDKENMKEAEKDLEKYKKENQNLNDDNNRFSKLEKLLDKSKFYSDFLLAKLNSAAPTSPLIRMDENKPSNKRKSHSRNSKGTKTQYSPTTHTFKYHSKFFTGGQLKDYQMQGVEWLIILYENGINGILGDEMGLGKTVQCLAFLSHLIENKVKGPYLIIAPLSTIPNWIKEFERFTPKITVILYHGSGPDRQDLQPLFDKRNQATQSLPVVVTSYDIAIRDKAFLNRFHWSYLIIDEGHRIKNYKCMLFRVLKGFHSANRLLLTGTPLQNNLGELWSLLNFLVPEIFDDLSVFMSWFDISEMCQNLKDDNPDGIVIKKREEKFVNMLHQILAPFLLRRMKSDVDFNIPPKKEILVYSPLSDFFQAQLYKAILEKDISDQVRKMRTFLSGLKISSPKRNTSHSDIDTNDEDSLKSTPPKIHKRLSSQKVDFSKIHQIETTKSIADWENLVTDYRKDMDDTQNLADNRNSSNSHPSDNINGSISVITLTNIYMKLRKCCNHPYLVDAKFLYPIDENMIKVSGKMMILDQLLSRLIKAGHKVLIFSQMTSMLDILEDYCDFRRLNYARLDGTTALEKRKEDIEAFQSAEHGDEKKPAKGKRRSGESTTKDQHKENPEKINVYLISTRAGGLGINLSAANCVIIYDSDWNPQSDLQAQDRCHRIGQNDPVVVYRLVTENTIDQLMVDRAFAKKKLEKMVIPKEKFRDSRKNLTLSENNVPFTIKEMIDMLKAKEYQSLYKTSTKDGHLNNNHHASNNKRRRTSKGSDEEFDMKLTEAELKSLLDWKSLFPEYYKKNLDQSRSPDKTFQNGDTDDHSKRSPQKAVTRSVFKVIHNEK